MNQLDYALDDPKSLIRELESDGISWEVDPADLAIAIARPDFREAMQGQNLFTWEMRVVTSAAALAGYHVLGEAVPGKQHMLESIIGFEKKREEP